MLDNNKRKGKSRVTQSAIKLGVIALIAGIIGGGATVGGAYYLNEKTGFLSTAVQTKSTTGTVKVKSSNVKGTSQSTKAFNAVSGAVVSVINLQSSNSSSLSDYFSIDESTSSSNDESGSTDLETASEGSGVIYKTSGNKAYIVTNNHVVSGSSALQVLLGNGTKLTAKLVGTDEYTDLAVLSIDSSKVDTVADFADSTKVDAGQTVLAIGSPLGTDYATSVTQGIVSAKNRTVDATNEDGDSLGKETVIQTDAAINQGNSGGPLINLAGQVVGINSMKLTSSSDGTSVEGMGFAIPSNTVVKIINQLEKKGSVSRPGLGISMFDLSSVSTSDQSRVLKLPTDISSGVVVMSIVDDAPAENAGLKKYDVITKIDDTDIASSADLRTALYAHQVGDKIKVTYYREGKSETTTVDLTKAASEINSSDDNETN